MGISMFKIDGREIALSLTWGYLYGKTASTLTKKSLATLDGEIVDPEITVKLEMRNVLKVHDAQT